MTTAKRTYYRPTTSSQRKLLFATWQETEDIDSACQVAKVSRRTFYYWKPRFQQDGFAGLETTYSHAPHNPHKIDSSVVERVLEKKKSHPDWGRHRIADELMKENNWEALLSASSVRRILIASSLWNTKTAVPKKKK
jgi:transposase